MPGDVLGLDTVLCECRTANIRTLTPAVIEIIAAERDVLQSLTSGSIGLCIWRLLSERQQRVERLLATISCIDARGRIAAMVLEFYQRLTTQKLATAGSFNLPLPQHQIANFLGMTLVHVNRTIRALSDDRMLKIEKTHLTILDFAALGESKCSNPHDRRKQLAGLMATNGEHPDELIPRRSATCRSAGDGDGADERRSLTKFLAPSPHRLRRRRCRAQPRSNSTSRRPRLNT
jgi:hypothetical protein